MRARGARRYGRSRTAFPSTRRCPRGALLTCGTPPCTSHQPVEPSFLRFMRCLGCREGLRLRSNRLGHRIVTKQRQEGAGTEVEGRKDAIDERSAAEI